ncbi:MAG: hypothetical protein QOH21_2148 [Acidobacteriota bacterium]|nr:hypothetical protein [Acidobacteriota bacterium]
MLPEPGPSYPDLRAAVRKTRVWVILTFVLGLVAAPFALILVTRALVRFREIGKSDPVSYRELVVLRRMTVGLILVWSLLLAGWAGLELRGKAPADELVLDATFARMVAECSCPNTTIYLSPGDPAGFSKEMGLRLSAGRHVILGKPIAGADNRFDTRYKTVAVLFPPRFVSKNLAEVSGQLRNGATGSFGATYTVRRDAKGVWKAISRQTWWSS